MARFIFITGGVVSSLGKGLASAALGVVPARTSEVPAAQILLDVRAVLAVALRRFALFDTCASSLRKLPAPERRTIGPLGRARRCAEARTVIRATELAEEQVEVSGAHAPLVHVVQPATALIEAGEDGHLRLVLIVGVGRKVRMPKLVDDLVPFQSSPFGIGPEVKS